MDFVVIIPARYASTRLPGKPLLDVAGKPLIQHVYERGLSSGAREVIIATDDERIQQASLAFGASVCMTSSSHQSGTDRIAEVVAKQGYSSDQIIVNLQGDEPLIPISLLLQVANSLHQHSQASMATLCEPIATTQELFNPNVVKVVMDKLGYALYFSRAPIPWERDGGASWGADDLTMEKPHYRHIGMYAYRASFLSEYSSWDACEVEISEALEQLRALWHGHRIHVDIAQEKNPVGVDTPEDLEEARAILSQQ